MYDDHRYKATYQSHSKRRMFNLGEIFYFSFIGLFGYIWFGPLGVLAVILMAILIYILL